MQKLDANGNLIWALKWDGSVNPDGSDIFINNQDEIYLVFSNWGTLDTDPGPGISNVTSPSGSSVYLIKLASNGSFIWSRLPAGLHMEYSNSIEVNNQGSIYIAGATGQQTANPIAIIKKLDAAGWYLWGETFSGPSESTVRSMKIDDEGNIYMFGHYEGIIDVDPSIGTFYLPYPGFTRTDMFLVKWDSTANFVWAHTFGTSSYTGFSTERGDMYERDGVLYIIGTYGATDFDFGPQIVQRTSNGQEDIFVLKLNNKKIEGRTFHDFNENCLYNTVDLGLPDRRLIIQPGNIVVETNSGGTWYLDSLSAGNYTITADTSTGPWVSTCSGTQAFTVQHVDSFTKTPFFGYKSTNPCPQPDLSIHAPFLRPGFSGQEVFVQVCNLNAATGNLQNPYVIIELDSLLTVQSGSMTYIDLGNNQFQVNLSTIYPGYCESFTLSCSLSTNAVIGQTLCMDATVYPISPCVLDTIPTPYGAGSVSPCSLPYDNSTLKIFGSCVNDSIRFVIHNVGLLAIGDMQCYAPVRIYIDGIYMWQDSIQLLAGDSVAYVFSGDGRTWRMEVNQHPLHLGNSHPTATVERCGYEENWTPDLVNVLPQDDADPVVDIYCGLVSAAYDPNDKVGYPIGFGSLHEIAPNQELEYRIRFQNTGTDTAFNVVIRDTLPQELDVFSIRSGVASHNYSFRTYGPRVLEWTFENVMLPDSNRNEPASHGFVKFKVNQIPNLPIGTVINNTAQIYFDFNPPIYTNISLHTISLPQDLLWDGFDTIDVVNCDSLFINGLTYNTTGTYWQPLVLGSFDSLITIHYTNPKTDSIIIMSACQNYTLNNQNYSSSGSYIQIVPNSVGCDSSIHLELTILDSSSYVIIESSCDSYMAPDAQIYTTSGQYTATVPNSVGCDSVISIDLTISNSTTSQLIDTSCYSYIAPDAQVYTASGQYQAVVPNSMGCDSTITIDLTISDSSSSVLNQHSCFSYMAPNFFVYTFSGQYQVVIPNTVGCDSNITMNLIIDSIPANTVSQNGFQLTVDAPNLSYQWVDCNNGNSPILSATNQSFSPTANGNYAVQITNGTCVELSSCINIIGLNVSSLEEELGVRVYPNPTESILNVHKGHHTELSLKLVDNLGRILMERISTEAIAVLDLTNLSAGAYYLTINNGTEVLTQIIIKK